jgi:hypothetical protein
MTTIAIERTKKGYPAYWVGGGAATNTTNGRFVLDSRKHLKEAIFIKSSGNLSNEPNQALVGLSEGDIIVNVWGNRYAVDYEGWDAGALTIEASKIVGFVAGEATAEEIKLSFNDIPKSVIEGLKTYHNRQGDYFVKGKKEIKK